MNKSIYLQLKNVDQFQNHIFYGLFHDIKAALKIRVFEQKNMRANKYIFIGILGVAKNCLSQIIRYA